MTLGIFWIEQQTQFNHLTRSDRHLIWIHLAFLLAVTGMPFSTKLLAEFSSYRVALFVYWANMLALGGTLYWSWAYTNHHRLVKVDLPAEVTAAAL